MRSHREMHFPFSMKGMSVSVPYGFGLAVCPALRLLVTSNSDDDTLSVLALRRLSAAGAETCVGRGSALVHHATFKGAGLRAPMLFKFRDSYGPSGWMAFTGPATSRLLLVTDAGNDAVHVIDVVARTHVGFVAAPRILAGPRGVATRGSCAVVSAFKHRGSGAHVVVMFEGSGAAWTMVRVVAGVVNRPGGADRQLKQPLGLVFSGDGSKLVVAHDADRVSMFDIADGSFVQEVAAGLQYPWDVEHCDEGWLVACRLSNTIEFMGGDADGRIDRATLGKHGTEDGEFRYPSALAVVPGVGLVVRYRDRVQVFVTPDMAAMDAMSDARVAWMGVVARAAARTYLRRCTMSSLIC